MEKGIKSSGAVGRWIKRLIILGILGGGGYYAWTAYSAKSDAPPVYRTTTVTRGNLTQAVTATGQLNALVMVQVGSQISGTITKINVDFNSPVKAGEIVAVLDPATYKANMAQAEGDLANAMATLELARLNSDRKKDLREKNLSPAADFDKATADLHVAEAIVKVKTAALAKSKVDLDRCTILAPIDGIVISRKIDVGQTVAASLNAPVLFEIANDLGKMQIHANVAEADVGGVQPGQTVDFLVDAFPDRTFHGVVDQVRNAPTTVDNVVTYDTVINVENKDLKLKPGMTANVSIIVAQKENVLLVSNGALRFKLPDELSPDKKPDGAAPAGGPGAGGGGPPGGGGGGEHRGRGERKAERGAGKKVFVLPDGANPKPEQILITTGITDKVKTEVLTGLNEGQNVITGVTLPASSGTPNPMGNPFGGGGGGRR
jgi:HlyD family secretion protein